MPCNCDPVLLVLGLGALLGLLAGVFLALGLIADYLLPQRLDTHHE